MGMNDTNSLADTKWNCKYDVVKTQRDRKILRQLCEWKKVTIAEAEVCPDHS